MVSSYWTQHYVDEVSKLSSLSLFRFCLFAALMQLHTPCGPLACTHFLYVLIPSKGQGLISHVTGQRDGRVTMGSVDSRDVRNILVTLGTCFLVLPSSCLLSNRDFSGLALSWHISQRLTLSFAIMWSPTVSVGPHSRPLPADSTCPCSWSTPICSLPSCVNGDLDTPSCQT